MTSTTLQGADRLSLASRPELALFRPFPPAFLIPPQVAIGRWRKTDVAQLAAYTAGFKPQIAFQAGFMTAKAMASVDATVQAVGIALGAKLFQWSLQGGGRGVGRIRISAATVIRRFCKR
jgi:hypothetical protein